MPGAKAVRHTCSQKITNLLISRFYEPAYLSQEFRSQLTYLWVCLAYLKNLPPPTTRCHAAFQYICVTLLPYNASEQWNKVKNHLQGAWKDNDITHNLDDRQKDIAALNRAHLDGDRLESLASRIELGIKALNPLDWTQYFIFKELFFSFFSWLCFSFLVSSDLCFVPFTQYSVTLPKCILKTKSWELPHQLQCRLCEQWWKS